LALFTEEPTRVSPSQAWQMAGDFDSWEIVDHAADLFVDAGHLDSLVPEFAADEREFIRRTAFAMIAWGAVHLKKRDDADFIALLPLIEGPTPPIRAISSKRPSIGRSGRSANAA
jgi:3-methyladenine DNA glycosylase AlkD